jgi:hypothetical protein
MAFFMDTNLLSEADLLALFQNQVPLRSIRARFKETGAGFKLARRWFLKRENLPIFLKEGECSSSHGTQTPLAGIFAGRTLASPSQEALA